MLEFRHKYPFIKRQKQYQCLLESPNGKSKPYAASFYLSSRYQDRDTTRKNMQKLKIQRREAMLLSQVKRFQEIALDYLEPEGIKWVDIEKKSGIPEDTFRGWRSGRTRISLEKARLFEHFLPYRAEWIAFGEEPKRRAAARRINEKENSHPLFMNPEGGPSLLYGNETELIIQMLLNDRKEQRELMHSMLDLLKKINEKLT